jgi:hypothetical protein
MFAVDVNPVLETGVLQATEDFADLLLIRNVFVFKVGEAGVISLVVRIGGLDGASCSTVAKHDCDGIFFCGEWTSYQRKWNWIQMGFWMRQ